jgi:hypothetical protein
VVARSRSTKEGTDSDCKLRMVILVARSAVGYVGNGDDAREMFADSGSGDVWCWVLIVGWLAR